MTPAHDDVKHDAAAYVLGSLEPDERAAFEAHCADVPRVRRGGAVARRVTDALAQACPSGRRAASCATACSDRLRRTRCTTGRLPRVACAARCSELAARRRGARADDRPRRLRRACCRAAGRRRAVRDGGARRARRGADRSRGPACGAAGARAGALEPRARHGLHRVRPAALPEGRVYQVWVVAALPRQRRPPDA